ncbi:maleylacetoacetate isomerase [Bosea sp. AK1]|uniref:maleylacetoacetate isomerase n=1 Tax=Bosea sp. AK1 TaxID=2587160 RepID=UPI00114EF592|nr:maleylacetoacetate isomerase [Bosea sp. AK1]TQI65325.1 maleylacetoacetate isomerase [Bosea sp. AK1]
MIFHGYFRSSAAWRCRIAFNLKELRPETVFVHLRRDGGEHKKAAYRALNPQGLVPALQLDDGTILTQSLAIIEWLEETHPTPPLLPSDPARRALVRGFAQAIACEIHPLQNPRIQGYLRNELGQPEEAVAAWLRRWLGEGLAACEALVERSGGGGRFCFDDTPGLADICLVPQVGSAERLGVDTSAMPRLRAIAAACAELPAFSDAAPAKQPDFEP